MKNIRLTTTHHEKRHILINWDNVDFVNETASHFGDKYVEIHFGGQSVDVAETLEQIENKLKNEEN